MNRISSSVINPVRRPASALGRRVASGLVLAIALAEWGGAALRAQEIVVPNALAEQDGNTESTTPGEDNQTGIRIQYLLDASQFQALSGPAYLTGFAIRPDRTPGPSGPKTITVQVYVSTTTRALAQMSPQFSDNSGADRTLVFDGTLTLSSENLPDPGNTRQFDYAYPFTTPFLYDPGAGNLVLELDIPHSEGPPMRFDSVTGSPVVRNLSAPNAPTATSGQFFEAPVLRFTFEPAPAITIRTSQVEVCWDSVPGATYRVEFRSGAASDNWTSLADCVQATLETTTCIQDVVAPGAPRRFYRMVRTNCTPLPQQCESGGRVEKTRNKLLVLLAVCSLSTAVTPSPALAGQGETEEWLQATKQATARFHSKTQAVKVERLYPCPTTACTSGPTGRTRTACLPPSIRT